MPMEILDRFPRERHTAHCVEPHTFFDHGVDVLYFLVRDTIFPCRIAIAIISVQDCLVGRFLDFLTFFRG